MYESTVSSFGRFDVGSLYSGYIARGHNLVQRFTAKVWSETCVWKLLLMSPGPQQSVNANSSRASIASGCCCIQFVFLGGWWSSPGSTDAAAPLCTRHWGLFFPTGLLCHCSSTAQVKVVWSDCFMHFYWHFWLPLKVYKQYVVKIGLTLSTDVSKLK